MHKNLVTNRFKSASECVWWLWFVLYFNFCCFRDLAYTTLDKLLGVFPLQ